MGFESFRIGLQGGSALFAQANDAVRRLPFARPDPDALTTSGSSYYTVEDGRHVFEVEVMDKPVQISIRFTLCHPATVDAAFLALVGELMTQFDMEVGIDAGTFTAANFSEFKAKVSEEIAAERALWVKQIGPETYAATTREAVERFILPLCEPVAG